MLISEIERNDKNRSVAKSSLQAPGSPSPSVPVHQNEEHSFKEAHSNKAKAIVLSVGNRRRHSRRNPVPLPSSRSASRREGERRKPGPPLEGKNFAVIAFDKNDKSLEALKAGDVVYLNFDAKKEDSPASNKPASGFLQKPASENAPDSQPDYIVELSGKPSKDS